MRPWSVLRTWWPDRTTPADVLAARDTRIAQLEKQLADERFISGRLSADVDRLTKAVDVLTRQRDHAREDLAEARRDAVFADATRCECGGDAELHLRHHIVRIEAQAARDRANAVQLANENERLHLRLDEAERLAHIAEQLERAP